MEMFDKKDELLEKYGLPRPISYCIARGDYRECVSGALESIDRMERFLRYKIKSIEYYNEEITDYNKTQNRMKKIYKKKIKDDINKRMSEIFYYAERESVKNKEIRGDEIVRAIEINHWHIDGIVF